MTDTLFAQEAEQGCLGAMLIDAQAAARAFSILESAGDFVPEAHQVIFAAMLAIYQRNQPIDIITVANELRAQGKLDVAGSAEYIVALTTKPATAAHVLRYANIIAERALQRQLMAIGEELASKAATESQVAPLLDGISDRLFALRASSTVSERSAPMSQVVEGFYDWQWEVMAQPRQITGARLGIGSIDDRVGGFADWEIVLIKGEEKFGKTRLLRHSLLSTASLGMPVLVYVLEGNLTRWLQGCVAWLANVPAKLLDRGGQAAQTEQQQQRIADAMSKLPSLPVKVACNLRTVQAIQADILASWYSAKEKPVAVYIDYLQLLTAPQAGNRVEQIKAALEMMLAVNARTGMPIITASQVNKAEMTFYSSEAQHAASLVFQIERGPAGGQASSEQVRMSNEVRLLNTHKRYGPMLRPTELRAEWAEGRFYDIASEYDDGTSDAVRF